MGSARATCSSGTHRSDFPMPGSRVPLTVLIIQAVPVMQSIQKAFMSFKQLKPSAAKDDDIEAAPAPKRQSVVPQEPAIVASSPKPVQQEVASPPRKQSTSQRLIGLSFI